MGILAEPWPGDLDPARVLFRQRTITVLKGMGLWDDMTRIDERTVDDIAGYGPQLGVSPQRIYQLVGQIRHRIEQVQPPNGAAPWLPQDPTAVPTIVKGHGIGT